MIPHGKEIKVFTGSSNPDLADMICKNLGISLGKSTVTAFADGECSISINEPVRGVDVFIVQSTCKPVNDSLMELLVMIDAMKRASAGRITAVIPYFGYARQDRKAKARDPISAKLVANLLTVAGADRVLTMDLHAAQIQGFFDIPVDNMLGSSVLIPYIAGKFGVGTDDTVIVSPDLGSVTRARKFTQKLDMPLAIIDKRRPQARNKEDLDLSSPYLRYSLPQWMYSMWEKDWGKENAEKIAESFLKERPVWVRCNFNLASKEEILASLKAQQATAKPVEGFEAMLALSDYDYLESLEAFQKGWIQVQDISSALVGELAAPKKDSYVMDVCAAPGGKSLHIADKLQGTGCVEARDLTYQKVALIEENASRMGTVNVKAVQWDATEFDPASENKADLVIADLPCSGLGIIGRKPDIKYHTTEENLKELAKLQREILSVVWKYVKPGGRLIYSTCTINKEENAENARWITENLPFKPEDLTEAFPLNGEAFAGLKENTYPGADLKNGQIQILPGISPFEDFDGFFISVFKRTL